MTTAEGLVGWNDQPAPSDAGARAQDERPPSPPDTKRHKRDRDEWQTLMARAGGRFEGACALRPHDECHFRFERPRWPPLAPEYNRSSGLDSRAAMPCFKEGA